MFDSINNLKKRVEKEWDSLTKKNLQIYSNSMNNRIESFLLLNGKLQDIKAFYLIFN